ncbi:MAG: hypothetical protein U0Q55_10290 [Vicinamibacterales bacterium]
MFRDEACLFCGEDNGTPLTKEHIWSAWMTPSIRQNWPDRLDPREPPFTILARKQGRAAFEHVTRRSHEINEMPRCLCQHCNNVVLGRVENEFLKPLVEPMMLGGEHRELSIEDRLVIAAWAFKTLVVHNHARNAPPFLYGLKERRRFIKTLTPPAKNFRVWCARFDATGRAGHLTGLDAFCCRWGGKLTDNLADITPTRQNAEQ